MYARNTAFIRVRYRPPSDLKNRITSESTRTEIAILRGGNGGTLILGHFVFFGMERIYEHIVPSVKTRLPPPLGATTPLGGGLGSTRAPDLEEAAPRRSTRRL